MYRPLPEYLTIKESDIEGLGLFATDHIISGAVLGISHIYVPSLSEEIIRTPLGGFYNHSEVPNCTKNIVNYNDVNGNHIGYQYELVAIRDIEPGDEILVDYTFYDL